MTLRTHHGPLTDEELTRWYAPPDDGTWVRASFITTLDGRATGPGGLSGGLNEGSEADHRVFEHLREWADVVVVGAGTVRAEGYGPLSGTALVVLTRSEEVPETLRGGTGEEDGAEEDGGHGEVVVLSGHGAHVAPADVLELAAARGWRRIVVEGGPRLLAGWLQAQALDELCLTVRPVLQGGEGPLLVPAETSLAGLPGQATHLLTWGGDLVLRVRLR